MLTTGRDLARALAGSGGVDTAIVKGDIALRDEDFAGLEVPLQLRGSLTLHGDMSSTVIPVIDFAYLTQKVQLLDGAGLALSRIALVNFRALSVTTNPGMDLLARTPAGQRRGVLQVDNCMLVLRYCYPRWLRDQNYRGMVRAPGIPGPNLIRRVVAQDGCVNDTAAPVARRCWADRGELVDVALDALDADSTYSAFIPTNYVALAHNSSFVCRSVLSDECISSYGPAGCLTLMNGQVRGLEAARTPEAGDGPVPAHRALAPPLAGALAGAALLAAAGVVAMLLVRRHRRLQAGPGAGATELDAGAGGGGGSGDGGDPNAKSASGSPSAAAAGSGARAPASKSGSADSALPGGHPRQVSAPAGPAPTAPPTARRDGQAAEAEPEQLLAGGTSSDDTTSSEDLAAAEPESTSASEVMSPLTPPRAGLTAEAVCANELKLLPESLGRGTFGHVVVGLYGGQRVAVKLIGEAALAGPDSDSYMLSLVQEVEVLGRCAHPNVVRLLAATLAPPRPCLVMELMEESLDRVLYGTPGQVLPLEKVLTIAIDIARGLEYLHPFTVHRDLKPGNVLINAAASDRPVVKITDFGLSRLRSTVVSTQNPEAGTPPYMAPECFDPDNSCITHRADIYSLGVMLAEMLAGRRPWDGVGMVAIAIKVMLHGMRPTALLEGLSPERGPPKLLRLITQCWEADPMRRPAAAEVVKELMLIRDAPRNAVMARQADEPVAAQASSPPADGNIPVAPPSTACRSTYSSWRASQG